MPKKGDIVFVNEIKHVDGEDVTVVSSGIVTEVVPNDSGYGQGHNFLKISVFNADGSVTPTECDEADSENVDAAGDIDWVGRWSTSEEGPTPTAAPTEPPPSEQNQ